MFSKSCEYAIRASIFILNQSKKKNRVNVKQVAEQIDSPVAFTAKILQTLSNEDIIKSTKGPTGGYEIEEKKQESITLADIVVAIDGDSVFCGCGLGLPECNGLRPCPIHEDFKTIRKDLRELLENTPIASLTKSVEEGVAFLKHT